MMKNGVYFIFHADFHSVFSFIQEPKTYIYLLHNSVSVTIYCDTPCVRDLGALFGHVIKQRILT